MSIPYTEWPDGALQGNVPVNDSMQSFAALGQANVETTTNTPPTTVLGDVMKMWLIGTSPTGVWAGRANQLALCTAANVWRYFSPGTNAWIIWDKTALQMKRWSGSAWVVFTDGTLITTGTYASRPAASAATNRIYEATDVQERYFSNGTTWTLLPAGGSELGYAEITSTFSTSSSSAVDITGLSVTVTVGERPVVIAYGGNFRNTDPSTGPTKYARILAVTVTAGPTTTTRSNLTISGPVDFQALSRETRVAGLTPGVSVTFKLQLLAINGGTAEVYADSTDRPYIQVRTA